jgi:hypothetical protein
VPLSAFVLILPEVSANALQVYLDKLAETIGPDEHALLVLDQAGWHEAKTLRIPPSMTLEPLPPRSPELNPVERVWLFSKEKLLSHPLLDDYDAILDAAAFAWNRMAKEPGRLASLCSYPWIMNCLSS